MRKGDIPGHLSSLYEEGTLASSSMLPPLHNIQELGSKP